MMTAGLTQAVLNPALPTLCTAPRTARHHCQLVPAHRRRNAGAPKGAPRWQGPAPGGKSWQPAVLTEAPQLGPRYPPWDGPRQDRRRPLAGGGQDPATDTSGQSPGQVSVLGLGHSSVELWPDRDLPGWADEDASAGLGELECPRGLGGCLHSLCHTWTGLWSHLETCAGQSTWRVTWDGSQQDLWLCKLGFLSSIDDVTHHGELTAPTKLQREALGRPLRNTLLGGPAPGGRHPDWDTTNTEVQT